MTKHKRFPLLWIKLTISFFLLSGCNPETRDLFTPTVILTRVPLPTLYQRLPTTVLTEFPINTQTSVAGKETLESPTPSRTERPFASTPLPTLAAHEAELLVQKLLSSDNPCRLPCYMSIIPGLTDWEDARYFLSTFATEIVQDISEESVQDDGTNYTFSGYRITLPLPGKSRGGETGFVVKNNLVDIIRINPVLTEYNFKLYQLLSVYGTPSKVLLRAYANLPVEPLPFRLIIVYEDRNFYAFYEFEGENTGDHIIGCPKPIGPEIWVWAPGKDVFSNEQIELRTLGSSEIPLQPLEVVTDLDNNSFYHIYSNYDAGECINTPLKWWYK